MKKIFLAMCLLVSTLVVKAQNEPLRFHEDGSFKIIQFTDVHYKQGLPESKVAIELIDEVLDAEKPDLVVFTGDVIWAKPALLGLDEVFAPVIERKIPFAYIFGNHDDEFGYSRTELMDYTMKKPYNISVPGDKALHGVGNYILEIKENKSEKIANLLYLFDSHSYCKVEGIGGYDWLRMDQIQWYANESAAYTKENEGKALPSLAFMHIPLAEYEILSNSKDVKLIGTKSENECNGRINSGMFAAMKEAGDVMGVFAGHDHDNDYIGDYYGVYLAYGRYSGGKTVYNNLGKNGCRIINLKEGKREFDTSIYLLGGERLYPVSFPTSFAKEKK